MGSLVTSLRHHLLFAAALLVASWAATENPDAVSQALIWLPTGVAVAGMQRLGWAAAVTIAVVAFVHRTALGYPFAVSVPAALGSPAEAAAAVWLLRRLAPAGDWCGLRDLIAIGVAAAVAPMCSIVASWAGRALFPDLGVPFYSGWEGWWRMNALGVLAVVPTAALWRAWPAERSRRDVLDCVLLAAMTALFVAAIMLLATPGAPAAMMLTLVLPVTLFAALRLGPFGAATAATAGALTMTFLAVRGLGAFTAVAYDSRHAAIQIFLLALLAVPLIFGALVAERDATARQVLASEGLRQALLSVLPDVVYRLDADGRFLDVTVPPGEQLPRPASQMLGRRIEDLVEPAHAARMMAQLRRAVRGEATVPIEYPLPLAQGRLDHEMRFVRTPTGQVLALVRDITARKQAERLLTWQASVLERVAQSRTAAAVFGPLVDGLAQFLPPALPSILLRRGSRLHIGYAPQVPAAIQDVCEGLAIRVESGPCGAAAALGRTVAARDLTTDERWPALHGLARDHGLRGCWSAPVRAPDGDVVGTFAFYFAEPREPTAAQLLTIERAAVLAGLAIERERRAEMLASIQQNIGEGLFRSVPGEGMVHANDALAHMFGYANAAELQAQVNTPGRATGAHGVDLATLAAPVPCAPQTELELHRRDGSTFHVMVSKSLVFDRDGTATLCDATVVDVTARRQLEAQLRQAQKMEAIGQLAGGVAHDFNNLLTAIGGFIESARDTVPAGGPRRDLEEALAATRRGAALTRQLLAFSRRQVMQPRIVDLGGVVAAMAGMLRRVIGERHTLVCAEPCPRLTVRVDRSQLEQVLLNLVVNARDAMPHGGTITIAVVALAADREPGAVAAAELRVTDTGEGMSPEVQARAFDPFFTTKEPGKGTGLGLSTVYGIVQQSGGTVSLSSRPGHGTTVRIVLPQVDAAPEPEPTVTVPRPVRTGARVLVVEDEAMVRDLVERALRHAGHVVFTAPDGLAALELVAARSGAIDAVVSDVVMPRLGGRELASRLRQGWPHIPVLLMSGYADDADDLDTRDLPLLPKPFSTSTLIQALHDLLPAAGTERVTSPADAPATP